MSTTVYNKGMQIFRYIAMGWAASVVLADSVPAYAQASNVDVAVAITESAMKSKETEEKAAMSPVSEAPMMTEEEETVLPPRENDEFFAGEGSMEELEVQAVLTAQENIVVASLIDGVLTSYPYDSGDVFKKGDVLARFDCRFEEGKKEEIEARLRASARQMEAYDRLKGKDVVADVDYFAAQEEQAQLKALLKQAKAKVDFCVIRAPFDGQVTDSAASNHESVKSGRVLMEISSRDPLQAELMVPSVWLKWLKSGTPLTVYVHETGNEYPAKIKRIHGQVDPVTRTIQVVAEMAESPKELLPGMSGKAMFIKPENE